MIKIFGVPQYKGQFSKKNMKYNCSDFRFSGSGSTRRSLPSSKNIISSWYVNLEQVLICDRIFGAPCFKGAPRRGSALEKQTSKSWRIPLAPKVLNALVLMLIVTLRHIFLVLSLIQKPQFITLIEKPYLNPPIHFSPVFTQVRYECAAPALG